MVLQEPPLQVQGTMLIHMQTLLWQDLSNGKVLGICKEGGLYYFKSQAVVNITALQTQVKKISILTWHHRLGHVSFDRLKRFDEITAHVADFSVYHDCLVCSMSKTVSFVISC